VAVSADERSWVLLNVSPDVRQQILSFSPLGPPTGQPRGTGISWCVLTDAELDHTAGLLLLREGSGYGIVSTPLVRAWLHQHLSLNTILVDRPWLDLPLDRPLDLPATEGGTSPLRLRAFEVDRHVPRFVTAPANAAVGSVVGLHIEDRSTGGKLVYVPCLARLSDRLFIETERADALLLDGTFWSEDEPIRMGIGSRTASQMGHLPVGGPQGSLAWLADVPLRHRIYVHINNTNPMLATTSPEHELVIGSGVIVAVDGQGLDL
jgi:pyrroloquinoline quinone biosynthesis protein B